METLHRRAARVAVVDPDDRVLLLQATDPADRSRLPWWELPGGGIEPGESSEDAGRREVWEEAGLDGLEMSPPVWENRAVFDFGGYHFDQHEWIHVARHPGGDVRPGGLEPLEVMSFVDWEWVPVGELGKLPAAGERVIPDWLVEQLPAVLAGGWPEAPIPMGLIEGRS